MRVVQQPQRLGLQAMNDVLLAPQERMTMQTAVDGATLLQHNSKAYVLMADILNTYGRYGLKLQINRQRKGKSKAMGKSIVSLVNSDCKKAILRHF